MTLGTAPSNDTLDSCSVDSMSLDEHIEIKIPDARIQENRRLLESQSDVSAQNHNGDSERGPPEHNGIVNNGLLHHHHHHHHHPVHHHGSHHQLSNSLNLTENSLHNGLNGSTQFINNQRISRLDS